MPSLPRALRGEIATIQRDFVYPSHDGSEAYPRDEVLLEEGGYGYRRWDVYTRLMQDAHVGAVLQQRWGTIVGREWTIEPGGTSRKAKKAAELVEAQLKAMATRIPKGHKNDLIVGPASTFDEAVQGLLSSILYGLSVAENIWDQDGQEVYIQAMYPRDIRRFAMVSTPFGYQLRLRSVDAPTAGEVLHPSKFTVSRYCLLPTEDPWGLGKGSQLFYPVWAKRNAAKFWMVFADKMGNPTAIAKVPNSASREKRASVLAMLDAIASDSGIVIDADVMLEFVEAQSRGSNSTHAALIDWANDEISKAILGETGTVDQSGGGGSRARDEVANEQRLEVAKMDADMLSSVLNRTLLRHITDYNFGPEVEAPRIWWEFPELEERLDRQKEAAVVVSLAGAGFVPTREWVEERFDIELAEEEERFDIELAEEEEEASPLEGLFGGGDGGTPPAPGGEPPSDEPTEPAESAGLAAFGFAEGHDHADIADYYAKQAMGVGVGGTLGRIAALIDGATDLREVRDQLPQVMSATSSDFAEQLGQAIAAAELAGRWEMVEEIEQAEALDSAVIDNAEPNPVALPENPSPEQLAAIVTAIVREEFERDAELISPVQPTDSGWAVEYRSRIGEHDFSLSWDGEFFRKAVKGIEDAEVSDFSESDGLEVEVVEPLDFAKGKKKKKTPNCNPGKSHLCRRPGGSGSCVSLSKVCRYKPQGAAKNASDYVAAKTKGGGGGSEESPPLKVASKGAEPESIVKPPVKAATPKPIPTAGGNQFDDYAKLADGVLKPGDIKLNDDEMALAKSFMAKDEAPWVKKKLEKMQAEVPGMTTEEAQAIATWIGEEYAVMNQAMWGPDGLPLDTKTQVDQVNRLAAKGLHKLPSITAKYVADKALADGEDYDPQKPLKRHLQGMSESFVDKYRKALEGDGLIREETFFGMTHLDNLSWVESKANVTIQVKAKADGTGQGKYIDHFKNSMSEGEIIFPPQSRFKVLSVETSDPGPEPKKPGPKPDLSEYNAKFAQSMMLFKLESAALDAQLSGSSKSINTALGKADAAYLKKQMGIDPKEKVGKLKPETEKKINQFKQEFDKLAKPKMVWDEENDTYNAWKLAKENPRTVIQLEEA